MTDPMPDTPFEEDAAVCELAERFGLAMARYEAIEIYDADAIQQAGLTHTTPDYARIRKALQDGGIVPGARLSGVQYTLKRTPTEKL